MAEAHAFVQTYWLYRPLEQLVHATQELSREKAARGSTFPARGSYITVVFTTTGTDEGNERETRRT